MNKFFKDMKQQENNNPDLKQYSNKKIHSSIHGYNLLESVTFHCDMYQCRTINYGDEKKKQLH